MLNSLQSTKPFEFRVKNLVCYPKAIDATVSCNVENESIISLNAQLQHYQNVDPLLVR